MSKYKIGLILIICSLFMLILVMGCNDILSSDKESNVKTQDVDNITRSTRPCENACNQNKGICHANCGSSTPCHDQCDIVYQNCPGYWTVQIRGTSICNIDRSTNSITLHFTIKLRTTDTMGFYGCDYTFWPEYGNRYSGRTLVQRSFWLWQSGEAEAWVKQQIAKYGMGIGCP
ncbi:MAG: hypothetical protein JXJ04_27010 [Spirochaetales bacterium]|nr:hypothetical protein [Spirochaetales bacterium]